MMEQTIYHPKAKHGATMLQSRWVGWLRQKTNCLEISMGYIKWTTVMAPYRFGDSYMN